MAKPGASSTAEIQESEIVKRGLLVKNDFIDGPSEMALADDDDDDDGLGITSMVRGKTAGARPDNLAPLKVPKRVPIAEQLPPISEGCGPAQLKHGNTEPPPMGEDFPMYVKTPGSGLVNDTAEHSDDSPKGKVPARVPIDYGGKSWNDPEGSMELVAPPPGLGDECGKNLSTILEVPEKPPPPLMPPGEAPSLSQRVEPPIPATNAPAPVTDPTSTDFHLVNDMEVQWQLWQLQAAMAASMWNPYAYYNPACWDYDNAAPGIAPDTAPKNKKKNQSSAKKKAQRDGCTVDAKTEELTEKKNKWTRRAQELMADLGNPDTPDLATLAFDSEDTRVAQRMVEKCEKHQHPLLISSLRTKVFNAAQNKHANHVLQQVVHSCQASDLGFVFEEILPHACFLARNPIGMRVILRMLDALEEGAEYSKPIFDAVLADAKDLCSHKTGSVVMIHFLKYGTKEHKSKIALALQEDYGVCYGQAGPAPHVVTCAMHHQGRQVVEAAFEKCSQKDRLALQEIIIQRLWLLPLAHDHWGRHVIIAMLEKQTLAEDYVPEDRLPTINALWPWMESLGAGDANGKLVIKPLQTAWDEAYPKASKD